MNTVYVDTMFCVNFAVDYILLYSLKKLLRINVKGIRILIGALTAAALTFGVFLPFYGKVFSLIYRIGSAALVCFVSFGKAKPERFIFRTVSYIALSISYSGIITLVWLFFKPDGIIIYNDAVYFDISPVTLIICTLVAFIFISVYEKLKAKLKPDMKSHKVAITSGKDVFSFESFEDTGCNLCEPFSGLPVIIAERELIMNKDIDKNKLRAVPCNTINGEGLLLAFKPEKVIIDGEILKDGCYIALSDNKLTGETKSIMGRNIREVI